MVWGCLFTAFLVKSSKASQNDFFIRFKFGEETDINIVLIEKIECSPKPNVSNFFFSNLSYGHVRIVFQNCFIQINYT